MNFLNGEGNHAKAILRESFDFTVKQGFGESTMIAGAHICLFYVSFFFNSIFTKTNDYCYRRLLHCCYYMKSSQALPCYLIVLTLKSHVSQQKVVFGD